MLILIGSHALEKYLKLDRRKSDLDAIGTLEDITNYIKRIKPQSFYPIQDGKKYVAFSNDQIYEFEIAWPDSSAYKLFDFRKEFISDGEFVIPPLNLLYTIKMSHRFLKNNKHFLKTMSDIHYMRTFGAEIKKEYKEWYQLRQKETYNYAHPNLKQNKYNFFDPNSGVKYVYDHDSIHRAVKHLDKPAYEYFKKDKAEVECSKDLFNKLPLSTRLYSVLEETYVLALERSQIPFKEKKIHPKKSFDMALEKVCTSISSGWWREFAWDNYYVVQSMYEENYVDNFWNKVSTGEVIKL